MYCVFFRKEYSIFDGVKKIEEEREKVEGEGAGREREKEREG